MLKRSFFGVFFLGVALLFGCSTIDNSSRGLAGEKAASVIGPNAQVILFYKDGSKIVVKECMEETGLKDSSYRSDCRQGVGAKTRKIPVEEFREDLRSTLRIPHGVSSVNYDGKTKERIVLYRKGLKLYSEGLPNDIAHLKLKKSELEKLVKNTDGFNGLYGPENNLKNTSKQWSHNARLAVIEPLLENGKNLEGAIDTLVDEVIAQSKLKQFVFSKNQTGFVFNLLRSYFRTSDDLQAYFVPVKAGKFKMGSPKDEKERLGREVLHGVHLTKGFEIQTTEVTQRQWFHVMGDNPSYFKPSLTTPYITSLMYCPETAIIKESYTMCPDHPVERVSFYDVQRFIKKLNRSSQFYIYRLPTEAEWEYAAREEGISTTPFNLGENISPDKVNYDTHYPYGSAAKGTKRGHTVAVGSLDNANALGISDMHGNVGEWVQDWYGDYPESDPGSFIKDPKGPSSGKYGVIRGGGLYSSAQFTRSAYRSLFKRTGSSIIPVGFRLVRTAKRDSATPPFSNFR